MLLTFSYSNNLKFGLTFVSCLKIMDNIVFIIKPWWLPVDNINVTTLQYNV